MGTVAPRDGTQRFEFSSRRERAALEASIASCERIPDAAAVESSQTSLQTDTGDLHAGPVSDEIASLPLGKHRNHQPFLDLAPGTTPARLQNAVIVTSVRDVATNVNGTAHSNKRLDGSTNVYVSLLNHAVCMPPSETVSTFHISTASVDAVQGMAPPEVAQPASWNVR